ncbi:transmembrane anchor protein [Roseibium sp.]|uniref:transmembrane anchor protein n=1 Tax=Roseibium sp. TaxID=1936156 RepID=UPI003BB06BD5
MYNANKPDPDQLPSSAQLLRSTILALIAAIVILVTVVLPAEYNIDPTGIGKAIGLAEMGEIKQELAREAEEDRKKHGDKSSLLNGLLGFFVGTAHAQEAWRDEITFTLAPGEYTEIKLVMVEGNSAEYEWSTDGGRINYDLHAHGGGKSVDYKKGRGETSGEGNFEAPFAGDHGWFWRNRDKVDVTVTLKTRGDYSELKQGQ